MIDMLFETANSMYEYNEEQKQIRRLNGKTDPTPRQGKDGEWKKVSKVDNLAEGKCAVILWEIVNEDELITFKTTVTSPIVKITAFNDIN